MVSTLIRCGSSIQQQTYLHIFQLFHFPLMFYLIHVSSQTTSWKFVLWVKWHKDYYFLVKPSTVNSWRWFVKWWVKISGRGVKYGIGYWLLGIPLCSEGRLYLSMVVSMFSPTITYIYLCYQFILCTAKELYLHCKEMVDQFLGSTVSGLEVLEPEFSILPAYFDCTVNKW